MSEAIENVGAPTAVLVHGAFADASSWNGVIERLQAKGVQVTAPANPLRGIAADSAYVRAVLEQIETPVVAVGLVLVVLAGTNGAHPRFVAAASAQESIDAAALARRTAPPYEWPTARTGPGVSSSTLAT